jgi:hypothetical protein
MGAVNVFRAIATKIFFMCMSVSSWVLLTKFASLASPSSPKVLQLHRKGQVMPSSVAPSPRAIQRPDSDIIFSAKRIGWIPDSFNMQKKNQINNLLKIIKKY